MRLKAAKLLPFLLIAALLLCGCDVYAGKRPCNYYNSRWVCEEPQIELVVDEQGLTTCFVGSGEEQQKYNVLFDYGSGMVLSADYRSSEGDMLFGDCSFGSGKMTVRVSTDDDRVFNGAYERLVFYRQYETDLEDTDGT